ncbi:MAG: hypothetical protein WC881_07750 [Elusimicrobiota bacterium]|jgi:hypothetical protein
MTELNLRIHGAAVRIRAEAPEVLAQLARDFEYFLAAEAAGDGFRLRLSSRAPRRSRAGWTMPVLVTRDYTVFESQEARTVRYRDGAEAVFAPGRNELSIYCALPGRLHELAYLGILSKVGEAMDLRGLHRIHALGFEWAGQGGLVLLPSGGGKSTLALELLRATSAGILSDDTPVLTQDGRMLAFPLRWGFRLGQDLGEVPARHIRPFLRRRHGAKQLVDVGFFRERIRSEVPVRWIFVGRKGASPRVSPRGQASAWWPLAWNLVLGYGIAQMAEYMFGWGWQDASRLARIARSRWRAADRVRSAASVHSFTLGPDAGASAAALAAYLKERI